MPIKKCAFIRTDKNGDKSCPFGLPITKACEHAGDSVANMAPLEMAEGDEGREEQITNANRRVYIHYRTGKRCVYAAHIMKDNKAVNCNWGDHAQGAPLGKAFVGSPLYPQTFSGIGLDGLYAFPLGFYADNNESRNLFHGLFSLVGSVAPSIVKQAVSDEDQNLWGKIERGEILLPQEQDKLNTILETLRQHFDENSDDPAKVKELADKWNPRKRL